VSSTSPAFFSHIFIHTYRSISMKRHFEFVSGTSAKFWEVSIAGCNVTVCFGRIGTDGQSQTKALASADAAQRHADKVIAEKMKKGYVEMVPA